MKYNLKYRKNRLFYKRSVLIRVISFVYFVFLTWQITIHLFEGLKINMMLFPLFLEILALIGMLHVDEWIFDKSEGLITYRIGILPFVKKKTILLKSVKKIELSHFVKGSYLNDESLKKKNKVYRSQVALSLVLDNDDKVDIEIIDEKKSGGRTESQALRICDYLDLPFTQDRARDLDLDVGFKDLK